MYKVKSHSVVSDSLRPHGLYKSMEFSKPEYWSGQSFSSSEDLPNPGIKPRSLALHADSLPAEPPGKPKNTGVGSLCLLQGIFLTQELNWISCSAGEYLQVVIHEKEDRQSQCYARVFSKVTSGKWLLNFQKFGKLANFTVVVAWNWPWREDFYHGNEQVL